MFLKDQLCVMMPLQGQLRMTIPVESQLRRAVLVVLAHPSREMLSLTQRQRIYSGL